MNQIKSFRPLLVLVIASISIAASWISPLLKVQAWDSGDTHAFGTLHTTKPRIGGAQAYLTTPNVYPGASRHSAVYVGTSGNAQLVEVGGTEDPLFAHYPCADFKTITGSEAIFCDTGVTLAAGGWYLYKLSYTGSGVFRTEWMDGDNVWHLVKNYNVGVTSGMKNVGSGGYSDDDIQCCDHFGTISTAWNLWIQKSNGAWHYYCYSNTDIYTPPGGSVSSCGSSYNWVAQY